MENCTCTGATNKWGDGAKCKHYSGYPYDKMNSYWCYAETGTCSDATSVKFDRKFYVDEGRYGPSQEACFQYDGKIITKIKPEISKKLKELYNYY